MYARRHSITERSSKVREVGRVDQGKWVSVLILCLCRLENPLSQRPIAENKGVVLLCSSKKGDLAEAQTVPAEASKITFCQRWRSDCGVT